MLDTDFIKSFLGSGDPKMDVSEVNEIDCCTFSLYVVAQSV